jgi:hypothetical protein
VLCTVVSRSIEKEKLTCPVSIAHAQKNGGASRNIVPFTSVITLSHPHDESLRAIRTFLRSEADTVGNSFKSSSNRRGSKPLIAGYKTKYI